MKKIIAATSLALFALAPAAAFAQGNSADNNSSPNSQDTATYPASGGAAGAGNSEVLGYGVLAGVGAAAVIGTAFAVADSGSDDKNVSLGGTGTTGTTGTN